MVAGDYDNGSQDDAANSNSDSDDHNRRFWKPMNETGSNYTMTVGYATPAPPPTSSSSSGVFSLFVMLYNFLGIGKH